MENRATLLGCAFEYLPVIFDIGYETFGITDFHIFQNIEVEGNPDLSVKNPGYTVKTYKPGEPFTQKGEHIFFGVTGPYGKKKVFEYFSRQCQIKKTDIGSLIHPTSVISTSTDCQPAVLIEPGVVISSQSKLGFGVTVKRRSTIGHHCVIEDFVEINPGVTISGHVSVERGVMIGSGAVIRNSITIGKNSVVGMGSVVTKDIPPGVIAYGNPCKVIRKNPLRV